MRAGVVVALALSIACAKTGDTGAFRPLDVGDPAPAYAAATLAGDTVRVGGTSSSAPTVLNVWATWCASCREEMAALDSLRVQYAPRGVRVVAVSVDEGDALRVKRFAETNKMGMTVVHDPSASIEQLYKVVGVPTTFVIGGDGRVVWKHTGNVAELLPEVRRAIEGGR